MLSHETHENDPFCPDCGDVETGGELCDDCRRCRDWTAWLTDTLRSVIGLCEAHGWSNCEGFDDLTGWLTEAESEPQRPESVYITLEHGPHCEADETIRLRISDHPRNVFRGRETGQSETDVSLAWLQDGGENTIEQLAERMAK